MNALHDLPRYDPAQSYRWNYEHPPREIPAIAVPDVPGEWRFCGRPVPSPLGIAAGPLLNGAWLLYYAALGFDVLTYKTVRSAPRQCYPLPNLQPVGAGILEQAGHTLAAVECMQGSWAISFGMPSSSPEVWRADVERTRCLLSPEKLLIVSVVASPASDWSLDDVADDFARCARWAIDSGADGVETNFSCPNVSSCDGQIYQTPQAAALIAQRVRESIGPAPYLVKIGFLPDETLTAQLIDSTVQFVDAYVMTNCIAARVSGADGSELFDGQQRGIGGAAIRAASVGQVRRFAQHIREQRYRSHVIGVGGISSASHVLEYLEAGAEAVQVATAVMLDPFVGCRIREQLRVDHRVGPL